jgi:periplasmic protein TonB
MNPGAAPRPLRYPIPRGSLGLRSGSFYGGWLAGDGALRRRLVPALVVALLVHAVAIGWSFWAPPPAARPPPPVLTQSVTLQKPPAPLPPPPEPAPPTPPKRVVTKAPAAAAAGKVIAAAPELDKPLDMTGFNMVIGKGNVYAGGVTASAGTSLTAVSDVRAKGAGASQARVAAPARTDWACAWPAEEEENTDVRSVRVLIRVHVDRDGDPNSVDILGPASATFERAARGCALNESYLAAKDDAGHAVSGATPPFSVHFFR